MKSFNELKKAPYTVEKNELINDAIEKLEFMADNEIIKISNQIEQYFPTFKYSYTQKNKLKELLVYIPDNVLKNFIDLY